MSRVVVSLLCEPVTRPDIYDVPLGDVLAALFAGVRHHNPEVDLALIHAAGDDATDTTALEEYGVRVFRHEPCAEPFCAKFHVFGLTDWEHVVHLDADCIVRAPLDDLFDTNCERLWARRDMPPLDTIASQFTSGTYMPGDCAEMPAFNAGVMAFRRPSARASAETTEMLFEWADIYKGQSLRGDQGYLNMHWADAWLELPARYNATSGALGAGLCTCGEAIVLHCAGRHKAWHATHPWHGLWTENLALFERC